MLWSSSGSCVAHLCAFHVLGVLHHRQGTAEQGVGMVAAAVVVVVEKTEM
jgi:hypothetical protein